MVHITKGKFSALVGIQVVTVLLSVTSLIMVEKMIINTPSACLTNQCASEIEIARQVSAETVNGSLPAAEISGVAPVAKASELVAPTDPASVRAMILSEYDSYVAKMQAYVATTYPTWVSVQVQLKSWTSQNTDTTTGQVDFLANINYKNQIGYSTLENKIMGDTHPKIESEIKNFCDLNHSIATEDERSYCHKVFVDSAIQVKIMQ